MDPVSINVECVKIEMNLKNPTTKELKDLFQLVFQDQAAIEDLRVPSTETPTKSNRPRRSRSTNLGCRLAFHEVHSHGTIASVDDVAATFLYNHIHSCRGTGIPLAFVRRKPYQCGSAQQCIACFEPDH